MHLHMAGKLIRYGIKPAHTAFVSGAHTRHVLLIGGLGDGMLLADYVPVLAERLDKISWSLVQPLLSSSLNGWGVGSLDEDASEIAMLARFLTSEMQSQEFVLLGHSTGCQDAVRYLNTSQSRVTHPDAEVTQPEYPQPKGVILQAPVSDRDWLAQQPHSEQRLNLCTEMIASGCGEDIAFRDDGVPMTARRFYSLAADDGDDNMFSSTFDIAQQKEAVRGILDTPTLWLFSGQDEFVPSGVDKQALRSMYDKLLLHAASRCMIVEGAPHSLTGFEDQAVGHMIDFIQRI